MHCMRFLYYQVGNISYWNCICRSSKSIGRKAAEAETGLQYFSGDEASSATVSSVSSEVLMKQKRKISTRSCIAMSKTNQVEEVMKRCNKAATNVWKGDSDCFGVTTRSARAKEWMTLRSKSLRKWRRKFKGAPPPSPYGKCPLLRDFFVGRDSLMFSFWCRTLTYVKTWDFSAKNSPSHSIYFTIIFEPTLTE